jgi:hypothetical protein
MTEPKVPPGSNLTKHIPGAASLMQPPAFYDPIPGVNVFGGAVSAEQVCPACPHWATTPKRPSLPQRPPGPEHLSVPGMLVVLFAAGVWLLLTGLTRALGHLKRLTRCVG